MDHTLPPSRRRWPSLPLYARVLIGVAAGIALGVIFKTGPIVAGARNDYLCSACSLSDFSKRWQCR